MFYLTYIKLINKDLRVMICMIRDQPVAGAEYSPVSPVFRVSVCRAGAGCVWPGPGPPV